jgi:hypothetical protein
MPHCLIFVNQISSDFAPTSVIVRRNSNSVVFLETVSLQKYLETEEIFSNLQSTMIASDIYMYMIYVKYASLLVLNLGCRGLNVIWVLIT